MCAAGCRLQERRVSTFFFWCCAIFRNLEHECNLLLYLSELLASNRKQRREKRQKCCFLLRRRRESNPGGCPRTAKTTSRPDLNKKLHPFVVAHERWWHTLQRQPGLLDVDAQQKYTVESKKSNLQSQEQQERQEPTKNKSRKKSKKILKAEYHKCSTDKDRKQRYFKILFYYTHILNCWRPLAVTTENWFKISRESSNTRRVIIQKLNMQCSKPEACDKNRNPATFYSNKICRNLSQAWDGYTHIQLIVTNQPN